MDQENQPERGPTPPLSAETAATKPTTRRKYRAVIISSVIIAVALYFAWRWYQGIRDYVSTDDAMIDANRFNVSAKTLGRIDSLGTDEGDTVRAGQVLVRFDVSDLQAAKAQTEAALTLAEENVRLAQLAVSRSQRDLDRAQVQFRDRAITAEQLEHAENDAQQSAAKLAIARAQIAATRAQIAVVDTSLANATILSPLHGVVSKRWALPGDVVQPAQPIFTIYDLDSVWVTANLEETKLARIHLGDAVMIHVDAYPDTTFDGRVVQISTNTAAQFSLIPPNNASGNFTKVTQRVPVKISIADDAQTPLLPGMSVVVKVRT